MLKLNRVEILQHLCIATNKWGLYLLNNTAYNMKDANSEQIAVESFKAAPYLDINEHPYFGYTDETCYLLFDTEEECYEKYNLTVGDEGPTSTNSYEGPGNVYAMMVSNLGEGMNENT